MIKKLIIILALSATLFAAGYLIGGTVAGKATSNYQPPENLDYLIECMKTARDSHQQFLDMPPTLELGPITINEPARYYLNRINPHLTLEDQREWVDIHDQVIEELKKCRQR